MQKLKYIISALALSMSFAITVKAQPQSCIGHATMSVSTTGITATITASGATTFCAGGSVVLNANTGAGYTYQWKLNGATISGATAASYTAAASGSYTVTITSGANSATSSSITVTKLPKPAATITAQGPTTFCAGGSVVLSANAGTGLTYKWKKGGNYISGATLSNYTASIGGNYRVEVTRANGCSKTSAVTAVTINCKTATLGEVNSGVAVSVAPNPFNESAVISISGDVDFKNAELIITDVLGKTVNTIKNINNRSVTIEKGTLHNGLYFYQLKTDEMPVASGRFMVE